MVARSRTLIQGADIVPHIEALIEADPLARGERRLLMTDSDWIGLQSICAD